MSTYFQFIDTNVLDKKLKMGFYPFTSKLFYQTNLSSLQATLNKNEIIETILTIGLLQDFYVLLKLYKKFEIASAIKCSFLFDKKLQIFVVYILTFL